LNVEKVLLLAKQTQVHAEKRAGQEKKWHKNYTKKHEMASVTFLVVCATARPWRIVFKIEDVHGIELHDVRSWKFVYFRKIFLFLLHITRGVRRGARGTIPRTPNHCGGPKSHNNVISTSFHAVHLLPQDEHGGAKLVSCPSPRLTSLRLCTSRLSSQIGEICSEKYLSIRQTINYKLFK